MTLSTQQRQRADEAAAAEQWLGKHGNNKDTPAPSVARRV